METFNYGCDFGSLMPEGPDDRNRQAYQEQDAEDGSDPDPARNRLEICRRSRRQRERAPGRLVRLLIGNAG